LPAACRFTPTCSEYAYEAVERYGTFRGLIRAAARVLRCHPCIAGLRSFDIESSFPMEKRVILAFICRLRCCTPSAQYHSVNAAGSTGPDGCSRSNDAHRSVHTQQSETPRAEESVKPVSETIRAQAAEEPVFDTPLYTATFSNVGAVLKSFKLKKYLDGARMPLETDQSRNWR
jgi:putative membrane protein insertion efficiency factor